MITTAHGSETTTADIGCTSGELIISAARADACDAGTVYGCSSVIWIGPGAYATEGDAPGLSVLTGKGETEKLSVKQVGEALKNECHAPGTDVGH